MRSYFKMNEMLKHISQDVYDNGTKKMKDEDIFDAIKAIRPDSRFDITFKEGTLEYHHFWDPNNSLPPTFEEIMKEYNYQKECKEYYQYAYDRCQEYPDGFEQFDMLWHCINEGKDLKQSEWFQTIRSIKEKYPKPNVKPPSKNNK